MVTDPPVLYTAGSMTLEFTRLSQLTGNQTYFDRVSTMCSPFLACCEADTHHPTLQVQRVTDYLDQRLSKKSLYPPLFPTTFDPDGLDDLEGVYSFGGQADRYVCPPLDVQCYLLLS